jgi:hypothetical protein
MRSRGNDEHDPHERLGIDLDIPQHQGALPPFADRTVELRMILRQRVMIVNGTTRGRRRVCPLVAVLVGMIFSIALPTYPNAAVACCTIPPPPPCETHPEMCA